jgi:hypothetical protein
MLIKSRFLYQKTDHQFFFQPTPGSLFTYFNYLDTDINGIAIGLIFKTKTGPSETDNLTITLRHKPDKSGLNVSNGDITNAAGETDVEVTFPIIIL